MKRNKFYIIAILITILSSCAVTAKLTHVFDETIPLDRSTWISAGNAGDIIAYNGIPVNWTNNNPLFPEMIQIPAGETTLEWNVSSRSGNIVYTGRNLLFRFNFQPLKQYLFLAHRQPDGVMGFNVYAYDIGEDIPSNIYQSQRFVEFVPFF